MPSYVLTPTDIEQFLIGFATRLFHTPGASHLGELAAKSKAIPEPLLADLIAKLSQLNPRVVGWVKEIDGLSMRCITQKVLSDPLPGAGSARAGATASPRIS
jgi:hypothetical protein